MSWTFHAFPLALISGNSVAAGVLFSVRGAITCPPPTLRNAIEWCKQSSNGAGGRLGKFPEKSEWRASGGGCCFAEVCADLPGIAACP